MTLKELKQTPLYPLMQACGYTDNEALNVVRNWKAVKVDDGVRFEPAPKTVDVPMGRKRK